LIEQNPKQAHSRGWIWIQRAGSAGSRGPRGIDSVDRVAKANDLQTFDQLGAFGYAAYSLTGRGEPEQVAGGPISPSLVPLLGLRPVAGRTFREGEDKPGSAPVAMTSRASF
jgi:hypothetical protein